jgi:glycogen synthase
LTDDDASEDGGNGFLFKDYDPGGLWYGLSKSVQFHRKSPEVRERQIRRIMREARKRYDLDTMVDSYVRLYETLNGGEPLV